MSWARRAAHWCVYRSDRVLGGALLAGALAMPWYQRTTVSAAFLGGHPAAPLTVLALLCAALALALRSQLHRGFVWLHPAELTWSDTGRLRHRRIGRRLWQGWLGRCLVVGYLLGAGGQVFGWSRVWEPVAVALFAAVALLAVTASRRPSGPVARWAEQLAPVLLALLGAVLAVLPTPVAVDVRILWPVAALAAVAAIGCAVTGGRPGRPRVATLARRAELVSTWTDRVARRVSVGFLDLLALLPGPTGRPWRGLLGGGAVAVRFAVSGVVSRARTAGLWLLIAVCAAILHAVLPRADPLWWFGVGGYLAALPFAAGLSQLYRQPGLRRWLGCGDRELRIATGVVVLVLTAAWCGLIALLGVPLTGLVPPAVVVISGAVVRTATRPAVDYNNLGVAVTPDGNMIPFGLIVQLARGPEVLVIGLALLATGVSGPFGIAVAVLLAIAATAGVRT